MDPKAGATFWPEGWRKHLCACSNCKVSVYCFCLINFCFIEFLFFIQVTFFAPFFLFSCFRKHMKLRELDFSLICKIQSSFMRSKARLGVRGGKEALSMIRPCKHFQHWIALNKWRPYMVGKTDHAFKICVFKI